MPAEYIVFPNRIISKRSIMIYGHFIEHFHRQIYGGIYDPTNPLSDEDGLRSDVLEAMRKIKVPVLRWPGGCFVSAYHWKNAVGPVRTPMFDKAWRVEDPNLFGTDEYIKLCRKIGSAPYICTNAGTGTAEEMSDWVEYCNLESEGAFARQRIENGFTVPHHVPYWSIGNENYGFWEIGAKDSSEWGRLVLESAKMMKHVDPSIELSAAALADIDWNINLLKLCGQHLDWLSIHKYWDTLTEDNSFADYEQSVAYTNDLDTDIRKVRGLLMAMGLEGKIKIAYDEWNLRSWHHPNVICVKQGLTKEDYLYPRDKNDRNQDYTMADAVFTACFLNTLNRNSDIVGMANFSPIVNTRGCIYTHRDGIVLRSTYHVFDLYVNYLGDTVIDCFSPSEEKLALTDKQGLSESVNVLDVLCTHRSCDNSYAIAVVNKHPFEERELTFNMSGLSYPLEYRVISVNGESKDSYNDVGLNKITLTEGSWQPFISCSSIAFDAHSVNVMQIRAKVL